MKYLLLCGLIFVLAACGVPEISTAAPTPEAIHIIYPSTLKPWADKIGACASGNPTIALYFTQSPNQDPDIFSDEVNLELGEPAQKDDSFYLSQVGREQIVVVLNQDNKLSQLSTNLLRSIYSGETTRWVNNAGELIQVWVLPKGDPARSIFENVVLPSQGISSNAMLAPDPTAMLEAVTQDAAAIGFLPESFLFTADPSLIAKVKSIQLDVSVKDALNQPVIAVTQNEPQGLTRELLVCLQAPIP
jgi:hypothetical protein